MRQRKNLLTSVGIEPMTSGLDLPLLCRLSYEVGQRKSGTFFGLSLVLRSTPQGRRYYEFRSHFASKIHQGVWQITSTNPTIKCLKFLIQSATRWKPLKASLNTWILTCRPGCLQALFQRPREVSTKFQPQKDEVWYTAIPLSAKAHSKTWWKTCQHLPG